MSNIADGIDDLFCAFGNFALYVAIKGTATANEITITHLAIYSRDDYEFGDRGINNVVSQPLGWWNPFTNYAGPDSKKGTYVNNETFRKFRTKSRSGGDFLIFSTVRVVPLPEPVTIPKIRSTKSKGGTRR